MPLISNSAGFGLAAAGAWGAGDFSGGLAARRGNVFGVVVAAYSGGLLLMLSLAWWRHEATPPAAAFWFSVAAGVVGGLALTAFYAALAKGQMGIIAAVGGVLTAAIPVIFSALTEGWPQPRRLAGFALAAVAIWLISRPEDGLGTPEGLGLAVAAGVGFGAYLILIKQAGEIAVFWPLVYSRASSVISMLLIGLLLRRFALPGSNALPMALGAGIFDVCGVALFVLGTRQGRLDVVAVLSSLYPATTVVLARIYLKEHLNGPQQVGIMAALGAVALIA
jgi:drug/metabolite transporter (DMT)-like permease